MAKPNSDFDPNALTQKTDEHTAALDKLQARVGTNENFAKTFKAAAGTQSLIDEAVGATVTKLLKNDSPTQEAVTEIVAKIDNRETKRQLWGLGKIVAWVVSVIVAALVGAWINSLFK